jgi:ribosome-associated heat shock protein Hsp15
LRIDKFMSAVNVTKKRSIALDMLKERVVLLNGVVVKPSKEVKVGDTIEINYINRTSKFQVLKIPTTKSTPKSQRDEYVKEIE